MKIRPDQLPRLSRREATHGLFALGGMLPLAYESPFPLAQSAPARRAMHLLSWRRCGANARESVS